MDGCPSVLSNREKSCSSHPSEWVKLHVKKTWRCSNLLKCGNEVENGAKVGNGIETTLQESLKE